MKFDITKIANAIIYMLDSKSKYLNNRKIISLLFMVDYYYKEEHNEKVFGEIYKKDDREPRAVILENIFQIIIDNDDLDENDENYFLIKEMREYLKINVVNRGRYKELKFLKVNEDEGFDRELFSDEEFEMLKYIVKKFLGDSSRKVANAVFRIDEFRALESGDIII